MTWCPHVTVATVIERDGKFLLIEEHVGDCIVFNQPAGHLEPNESLLEAAVRETREETNWQVELTGFVGVSLYTAQNGITYQRNSFIAKTIQHYPDETLDRGIIRTVWMSHEEMQAVSARMRSPLVIRTVEKYLNGDIYPLNAIYE